MQVLLEQSLNKWSASLGCAPSPFPIMCGGKIAEALFKAHAAAVWAQKKKKKSVI